MPAATKTMRMTVRTVSFSPKNSPVSADRNTHPPVMIGYCTLALTAALVREWLKEFNRSRANRHAALVAQALLLKTLSYFDGAAATAADNDRRRALADLLARYIDEHFAEPALSLKSLGEIFHFHPNYISYTFKEYMGAGFAAYLRQKRLYKACELLKSGALVKDAAFSVGFSDAFYFERCFRKYIGVTPTEYREREKLAAKKRRKDDFASKFYM